MIRDSCLLSAQSHGDTITWGASPSGDWNDDDKWLGGVMPGAGDRAVIEDAAVSIEDDEVVDSIDIGADANLLIFGPGSLELENDDHNAHECTFPATSCIFRDDSIVNGMIELRANAGDAGDLIFTTNNHIFEGEGRIEDIKQGGRIEIDPDIFFLNRLIDDDVDPIHWHGFAGIHGTEYIFGRTGGTVDGEFRNEGRVQALFAGEQSLTLTIDAVTKDNSDAEWITSCEAVLLFKREALDLEGDFTDTPPDGHDDSGEFRFDADIWTCGTFTCNGCCGIEVDDTSFSYADFHTDTSCTNPGTAAQNPADCDDPFIVSTDVTATNNNCVGD